MLGGSCPSHPTVSADAITLESMPCATLSRSSCGTRWRLPRRRLLGVIHHQGKKKKHRQKAAISAALSPELLPLGHPHRSDHPCTTPTRAAASRHLAGSMISFSSSPIPHKIKLNPRTSGKGQPRRHVSATARTSTPGVSPRPLVVAMNNLGIRRAFECLVNLGSMLAPNPTSLSRWSDRQAAADDARASTTFLESPTTWLKYFAIIPSMFSRSTRANPQLGRRSCHGIIAVPQARSLYAIHLHALVIIALSPCLEGVALIVHSALPAAATNLLF